MKPYKLFGIHTIQHIVYYYDSPISASIEEFNHALKESGGIYIDNMCIPYHAIVKITGEK